MEKFCFEKVKNILSKLQPRKILVLGVSSTYDRMKKEGILTGISTEKVIRTKDGRERLVIESRTENFDIFAVKHLSGARINTEDRQTMNQLFSKWINRAS